MFSQNNDTFIPRTKDSNRQSQRNNYMPLGGTTVVFHEK